MQQQLAELSQQLQVVQHRAAAKEASSRKYKEAVRAFKVRVPSFLGCSSGSSSRSSGGCGSQTMFNLLGCFILLTCCMNSLSYRTASTAMCIELRV